MFDNGFLQIAFYLFVLICLAIPLGFYMTRVYAGQNSGLGFLLRPIELVIYRISGINPAEEMDWKNYAIAVLVFSVVGFCFIYFLQRLQLSLLFNPQLFPAVSRDLSLNTAVSYITNTNWQAYSGENTMSYLTQSLGLTVQNFVSAGTGMAVLVAFVRGFTRTGTTKIGNFWVDLTRSVLYILLPLATILAIILVSQGVIQNLKPYQKTSTAIEFIQQNSDIASPTEQILPMGPAASQVAIKQLGTNGGGFFGSNSTHPFENPTPLTNFLETLALLLIPAGFCFAFGAMVKDKRQGLVLLSVMLILFLAFLFLVCYAEQHGNNLFNQLQIDQRAHRASHYFAPGGNMEGKETRFGIVNSALWVTATTAASNGSVNAMLDSLTPVGGLVPLCLMQLEEIVFGGVGSGLYGMLIFVLLTVFIAGLMVGRTPEYLGKKIEVFEMKMTSLIILIPLCLTLTFTAIAVMTDVGRNSVGNPGVHGFLEILYAFVSTSNNNGSILAGLNANLPLYNILGSVAMLVGRFGIMISVLAIAGSLAGKKILPTGQGTMPTHTPLFTILILSVILIIGALSFFPALSLGPIVEILNFNHGITG